MSELIRWEYAGHEFKVSPALSPDQRDGVCSILLSEYDNRAERMPDNHRSHSPVKNNSDDRTHYLAPQDGLESVLQPLEGTREGLRRCKVCGKAIEPTGRRGRPRVSHLECAI